MYFFKIDHCNNCRTKARCISNLKPNRKCAVIIAGFVCIMAVSAPFSFAVLNYELLVYYNESRKMTSLVVSLASGMTYLAGI